VLRISEIKLNLQKLWQSKLNLNRLEAESEISWILNYITDLSNTEQIINSGYKLTESQNYKLEQIIDQRLNLKIPLQYILGEAYFMGLKLKVNQAVLIPRPETETLVELALNLLSSKTNLKILEIGAGSGCISIALAYFLQTNIQIIKSIDICDKALNLAKENAQLNKVNNYINFEKADLMSFTNNDNWDLLISNPPYINTEEYFELEPEVLCEPKLALTGNNNESGLIYYEKIADLKLKSQIILLELDSGRAEAIKQIFDLKSSLDFKIIKDLNNLPRFLLGI
jgi:release factor glutamine methyltransferase